MGREGNRGSSKRTTRRLVPEGGGVSLFQLDPHSPFSNQCQDMSVLEILMTLKGYFFSSGDTLSKSMLEELNKFVWCSLEEPDNVLLKCTMNKVK